MYASIYAQWPNEKKTENKRPHTCVRVQQASAGKEEEMHTL